MGRKPKEETEDKKDDLLDAKARMQRFLAGEVVKKFKKENGTYSIDTASVLLSQPVPRIPSGIWPLDYALGGGFPVGRVSIVYGKKSAGKTTTYLKVIGNAQKMCSTCWTVPGDWYDPTTGEVTGACKCSNFRGVLTSYIDVEGTYDKDWASSHGVDNDLVILSQPSSAEEAIDLLAATIKDGDADIIALDSIAFLVPQEEQDKSAENKLMGAQARLVNSMVRKVTAALNEAGNQRNRRPTLLFTNQIRMKIGVMFGSPETVSGGMAPGFAASIEVKLTSGKVDEVDHDLEQPAWTTVNFKIEKNKVSGSKMAGEYRLLLADTEIKKKGDVQDEDIIYRVASDHGLITGGGTRWSCLGRDFGQKSLIERELYVNKAFKKDLCNALNTVLLGK